MQSKVVIQNNMILLKVLLYAGVIKSKFSWGKNPVLGNFVICFMLICCSSVDILCIKHRVLMDN